MLLRQYLDSRKIRISDFAQRIGVREQTVYRYVHGERLPRRDVMDRIQHATRGAVRPNDFFGETAPPAPAEPALA